jgi:hypothetical protein
MALLVDKVEAFFSDAVLTVLWFTISMPAWKYSCGLFPNSCVT